MNLAQQLIPQPILQLESVNKMILLVFFVLVLCWALVLGQMAGVYDVEALPELLFLALGHCEAVILWVEHYFSRLSSHQMGFLWVFLFQLCLKLLVSFWLFQEFEYRLAPILSCTSYRLFYGLFDLLLPLFLVVLLISTTVTHRCPVVPLNIILNPQNTKLPFQSPLVVQNVPNNLLQIGSLAHRDRCAILMSPGGEGAERSVGCFLGYC